MQVTEQASKAKGAYVETKFDTGAYCRHMRNGEALFYNASGRTLNAEKNAKLIEKMKALAKAGIR